MGSTMITADASVIRSLAASLDPVASVYVDLHPAEPGTDAQEDLSLRWRRLATMMAAQGADEATLAAIWHHLARQPVSPAQYAVFASRGAVLFGQVLPALARSEMARADLARADVALPDLARFGSPAHLVPLLAWLQRHPAYVAVVTDRTGAEITAVPRGAVAGTTRSVEGPDDEIERNAPGGWAQARYQRRAEDSWQHNAAAVAREVAQALTDVGSRLLLIGGDVRAVQLLREHLPAATRHDIEVRHAIEVRHVPGGRSADGSGATRREAIDDAITEHVGVRTAAYLDRLDAERRPGGLAVDGVTATLAALAEGRVQTLFVVDDPDDTRVAWFGPDTLCVSAPTQRRPEDPWLAEGRLVDIAVRAALLTHADVHVVPPDRSPGERVGALCRFTAIQPVPAGLEPRG